MTVEESIKLLALIKLAYPNAYKNIDKDTQMGTVKMWQHNFCKVPFAIMEMALEHYQQTAEFQPSTANIREELKNMHYEALQNVLFTNGEQRKLNQYIMEQTEQFKKSNDQVINIQSQNLLNSANRFLIEG